MKYALLIYAAEKDFAAMTQEEQGRVYNEYTSRRLPKVLAVESKSITASVRPALPLVSILLNTTCVPSTAKLGMYA